MINLRLYRASLLLVPIAVIAAMFSLQSVPGGRTAPSGADSFDGISSAALARQLARQSPNPRPGSEADGRLATAVETAFGQVGGAQVSEQNFKGSFNGNDVDLRNVIAVLPGSSDQQVVVMAGRDAASGPGAGTAAASTATLMQLAAGFGGASHTKTLVFVSTDGTGLGADGARQFIDGYSDISLVSQIIVVSQPAFDHPRQPMVIPWSSGPQSTSIELTRTADKALAAETDYTAADESAFGELSRLAIPANLGEQGPLIQSGFDAVRFSSAGERPLTAGQDDIAHISANTIGPFGRTALATILALDASTRPLEHGPGAYIGLAGNLLPGWALAVISLSLILPLAIVAFVACARAARRPDRLALAGFWVLERSLPFIAATLLFWLFGLVGLFPTPDFPYDPARFAPGLGSEIVLAIVLAGLVAGLIYIRAVRPPPDRYAPAAAPACAAVIAIAGLAVWLANPYLALLLAPALHAWLLLTAESTAVGSLLAAGITLIGLVPLFIAIADLAGRFGVGRDVFWQILLLLGDGQISVVMALLGCVLAGAALAALALARSRIVQQPPEIKVQGPIRIRRKKRGDRDAPRREAEEAAGGGASGEVVEAGGLEHRPARGPQRDA
jgi:hypothetical protein